MKVFTTVSHTTALVELQVKLLRKNITDLTDIVVLIGPYGANPMTSAGNRVWEKEHIENFDADFMYAPSQLLGLMPGLREKTLISWLLEHVWTNEDGPCLFLHGDLLPIHPMNQEILMGGAGMAGRSGIWQKMQAEYVAPTWLAADMSRGPFFKDIDLLRMADLHVEDGYWCGLPFKGWKSEIITEDTVEKYLGGSFGYTNDINFEWCEPGFLHVDKMGVIDYNDSKQKKVKILEQFFNTELKELVPPKEGLPSHHPRVLKSSQPPKRDNKMKLPKRKGVPERGPGIFKMASNFTKAVVRHAADGGREVTPAEYAARLEVCNGCEFQKNGRCLHANCGCFLSKKAWWRSENCPEGKWPDLDEQT